MKETKIKTTRAHGKPSLEVICIKNGDLYNNDSVAIYARDLRKFDLVGEDHLKIEFPITPDGTVALTLYFAGFHIIPCSENVSFLKCIFCLDPHLDALPMSLLNFMVSKTAGVLLNLIREQVKPEKVKGSEYVLLFEVIIAGKRWKKISQQPGTRNE